MILEIFYKTDQCPEDQSTIIIGDRDEPGSLNQPAKFDEFACAGAESVTL